MMIGLAEESATHVPRHGHVMPNTRNAHSEPQEADRAETDQDEESVSVAAHYPHAKRVGAQSNPDTGNQERQAELRWHAEHLTKVAALRKQGEAKRLRHDAGEQNNHCATKIIPPEARHQRCFALAPFALNVALDDGQGPLGGHVLASQATLRR